MAHQQDAGAVDAPVSHTVDSAAAALSQAFQREEPAKQEERDTGEENPDVTDEFTDEDFAEGEEVEGEQADEQDEPEEPAIEAPVSLTADEKAAYAQLPKEAQDFVSSLEQRRNQDVQKVTTKAAEAQRVAEAKAASANQDAEARFAEQLKAFTSAFEPQAPDPSQFNDLQTYQRAKLQYDHDKAQHDQLVQQVGTIGVETDEMRQERIAARDRELMQIPEIANEETRDQFIQGAFAVARELGYDESELADGMGANDMKALGQAAKWKADSEELARIKAKAKERRRDSKTGQFRSLKPGAAQPSRSGNKAYETAKQRLSQTGKVEDAAAAFKAAFSQG